MRLVGSNSNVWTNGFGKSCAAIVSNNVSGASPWLAFFSNWGPRHRSHTAWPPPERAGGVYRWLARYPKLCRRTVSQLRDPSPWSPNMIRYDIERNRRIRQVRTVVWEDGAARPLLPDQIAILSQLLRFGAVALAVLSLLLLVLPADNTPATGFLDIPAPAGLSDPHT